MPLVPVQSYEADWKPENNAKRIQVWIAGSLNPWIPAIESEAEFAAILSMLSKPGVQVDTAQRYFHLARRPAGT